MFKISKTKIEIKKEISFKSSLGNINIFFVDKKIKIPKNV